MDYGGQGGLGDVVLHPDFSNNQLIYISYVEASTANTRGAAVARGKLSLQGRRPYLDEVDVIWRQYPKVLGRGHFGHRLAFDDAGFFMDFVRRPSKVYAGSTHAKHYGQTDPIA